MILLVHFHVYTSLVTSFKKSRRGRRPLYLPPPRSGGPAIVVLNSYCKAKSVSSPFWDFTNWLVFEFIIVCFFYLLVYLHLQEFKISIDHRNSWTKNIQIHYVSPISNFYSNVFVPGIDPGFTMSQIYQNIGVLKQ